MMADFEDVHDPGLQQERTLLAWDRTALALMITAGLLGRAVDLRLLSPESVVVGLVVAAALGLLLGGPSNYRFRWARVHRGGGMLTVSPLLVTALAAALLGVTSLLVVIAG